MSFTARNGVRSFRLRQPACQESEGKTRLSEVYLTGHRVEIVLKSYFLHTKLSHINIHVLVMLKHMHVCANVHDHFFWQKPASMNFSDGKTTASTNVELRSKRAYHVQVSSAGQEKASGRWHVKTTLACLGNPT